MNLEIKVTHNDTEGPGQMGRNRMQMHYTGTISCFVGTKSLFSDIECYARQRNQMQTRVDAEFVVFIQVEGRKPGYQRYTVQDGKQKSSQNTSDNQNQESEFRNTNKD